MRRKKSYKKDWLLNWNLLIIILGITLILEIVVVLISFDIPRKGYTVLTLSIAVSVIGYLAYINHSKQRKVLLALQGIEPLHFRHAGSKLNLILTVLISGSIFLVIAYIISEYAISEHLRAPLYFSLPEVVLGVMITVTKNITTHEILGKTLLIRVSFVELYIPIDNIESIKADEDRLPDLPKNLKLPRRYRAVSSYFGYRVLIALKKPQNMFMIGLPPFKKTNKILFDVDEPKRFVTAILERMST